MNGMEKTALSRINVLPLGFPKNKWSLSFLLSLLISAVLLTINGNAALAPTEYTAQGLVSYQLNRSDTKTLFREYSIAVKGNLWEVSVKILDSTNKNTFYYSYDGSNITYITLLPKEDPKTTSGLIEAAEVPHMWLSTCGEFVWMALASGTHFSSITNSKSTSIHALKSNRGVIYREEVPVTFTVSPSAPNLPIRIEYTSESIRYLDASGDLHSMKIRAPFENGYVSAIYNGSEFKKFGTFELPAKFSYKTFTPLKDAKGTNDLTCILDITGTVTNVLPSANFSLVMPANVVFQDARVQAPITTYRVKDGKIPETNNPAVQKAMARGADLVARDKSENSLAPKKGTSPAFRFVFLILFSAPLIAFAVSKINKSKL